nr:MAG TPA: hypothetical protein [Caudoviricetes sp.]
MELQFCDPIHINMCLLQIHIYYYSFLLPQQYN